MIRGRRGSLSRRVRGGIQPGRLGVVRHWTQAVGHVCVVGRVFLYTARSVVGRHCRQGRQLFGRPGKKRADSSLHQPAFVVDACSGRRFSERVVILDVPSQEPPDRLAAESGPRGAITPGSLDTAKAGCDATSNVPHPGAVCHEFRSPSGKAHRAPTLPRRHLASRAVNPGASASEGLLEILEDRPRALRRGYLAPRELR